MTRSRTEPRAAGSVDRRGFLGLALKTAALTLLTPAWPHPVKAGAAGAASMRARGIAANPVLPSAVTETARAWRAMGTLMEVRVPDLPPADAVEAVRAVRRRVEELEAAMTLYRSESPLVAFNRSPAGRWVEVPLDLSHGVAGALAGARLSRGAYDPTLAPLMRAWGLVHLDGRLPSRQERLAWRRRPGPEAVEVDCAGRRLRRLHDQAEIDLGGVGKGIAVDAALAELSRAGSRSALVNLGGSIGVLGAPPDSPGGWVVAVAHPRRPGEIWSTHYLRSGHLATSGDYERQVETPVGRLHHLLDPRTGEPTRGVASVTVWSPVGVEADVLSTATLVARSRGEGPMSPPGMVSPKAFRVAPALTLLHREHTLTACATGGFDVVLG